MTTSKCIQMSTGSEIWLKNKKIHREDGPAVVNKLTGSASFYIDNIEYSVDQWVERVNLPAKKKTYFILKYQGACNE